MTLRTAILGAAALPLLLGACLAGPERSGEASANAPVRSTEVSSADTASAPVSATSPAHGAAPSAPAARPRNLEDLQRAWLQTKGECLREAGFRAQMAGDGLDIWDPPPEQRAAFEEAIQACEAEAGPVPGGDPMTREELGTLYDLQLQARECLLAGGYPVTDPSSREIFISLYLAMYEGGTDIQPPWFAHEATDASGDLSAREACPEPTMADVYRANA